MRWQLVVEILALLLGSGVLGLLWGLFRAITRFLFLMEEFPPHRHVRQAIVYPKGLSPQEVEELKV